MKGKPSDRLTLFDENIFFLLCFVALLKFIIK
jgi:hypothetical protein